MAELQGGKRSKLTRYCEYDHVWSQFDDNVNNTECMKWKIQTPFWRFCSILVEFQVFGKKALNDWISKLCSVSNCQLSAIVSKTEIIFWHFSMQQILRGVVILSSPWIGVLKIAFCSSKQRSLTVSPLEQMVWQKYLKFLQKMKAFDNKH